VNEFWQRATQILASEAPAVLATVIAVHRQVPKVSLARACLIVTPTDTVGGRDDGAVDRLVMPFLQSAQLAPATVHDVSIPTEVAHRSGLLHGGTEDLSRIQAPIGLNLGAEFPFETAVAILAQLIQVQHSHTGSAADWTLPAARAVA
jgi:xanthine/CO dehydrogenase XdhC/CoxF family maturation factor